MSSKIVNDNEFNSLIQLASKENNHITDSELPIGNIKDVYEQDNDEMIFIERRAVKSERRISDNHDYRGPARRLTIDRRK